MAKVSIVVPLYNEEENVKLLYDELNKVCPGSEYEFIFVDDGSKDNTIEYLLDAAKGDQRIKVLEFRRNFGQTAAMAAGLQEASGDYVVTMDGDLQNDPSEIPNMVTKIEEGYDLVAGWRKDRQDKFISRKLPSMIANKLIAKLTGVSLHDVGCSLKVMTKELAKEIKLYGEMHRFIPALANQIGAKIVEVPVNHRARIHGESKYGISRTIRVVLDLMLVKYLLGYSKRPIHLFGFMGLVSSIFGSLLFIYLLVQKFCFSIAMGNRPLLSLAVLLIMIGLQFLVFGILAEVLARTYYESQEKDIYMIRKVHTS